MSDAATMLPPPGADVPTRRVPPHRPALVVTEEPDEALRWPGGWVAADGQHRTRDEVKQGKPMGPAPYRRPGCGGG